MRVNKEKMEGNRDMSERPEVKKCEDGKYRWYYELGLLRNPTILFVLWKIFFWIGVGLFAFMSALEIFDGNCKAEAFLSLGKVFGLATLGLIALCTLGYLVYAAIMGFKYCVVFEMDDKGITHTQSKQQFRASQKLSLLEFLVGVSSRNPTLMGAGLITIGKQTMRSDWSKVKSVEIIRRRNVIKVNESLMKNQVYVRDEDFDFVVGFIRAHVSKKCDVKG